MKLFRTASPCLLALPIFIIILLNSCTKDNLHVNSAEKAITSFKLVKSNGNILDSSDITVSVHGDSIDVSVPQGTDLTNLTPQITIAGVSVSPASGVTQDFSSPITYTVTAADGTSHSYTVSVKWKINNKLVFFGSSDHNFYALDAERGLLVWKYTATKGFSYSSPTVWNNTVYAGCIDGNLYAFDAASGNVLWKFAAREGIESSPAIANGVVYFGSDDDYFYAVDATTGQLRWEYKTGFNVGSSPTIVDGVVYVGSDDNNLYAFDAASGNIRWTFNSGSLFNASSPLVENGSLYIGNRNGYLYCIDAASGTLKWKYSDGGISMEQSSPTIYAGVVYIGEWYNTNNFSVAGSLVAVDANTGTPLWTSLNGLGVGSSPVIESGNLYIAPDDTYLYSINAANGATNWKVRILPNGASAAVANSTVYIGGGGTGCFYALDTANGNVKWKFPIGNSGLLTSSPCIIETDGTIFHPGVSGEQY